jgi:hypothetical protein
MLLVLLLRCYLPPEPLLLLIAWCLLVLLVLLVLLLVLWLLCRLLCFALRADVLQPLLVKGGFRQQVRHQASAVQRMLAGQQDAACCVCLQAI